MDRPKAKTVFLLLLCFLLLTSLVSAEEKYTREESEKLFHLLEWQDYSPDTFAKALQEQKSIYLVVSAPAWCYWCHVYESEDYLYHPALYPYINEHFIPVFVDSDKRPDLTRKYLEGGWPSTTLLAPDGRRINGFTGPREPLGLRSYLGEVITYLANQEFSNYAIDFNYEVTKPLLPEVSKITQFENNILTYLASNHDEEYGGFVNKNDPNWRAGQKFPSPLGYELLLQEFERTHDDQYLEIVHTTFRNQYTRVSELETRYHLYDPVEGGFHRYSTSRDWSVPHYEKMLGDQAKFILAYDHLFRLTGDSDVGISVNKTISFVMDKFLDPEGGFYSSQDAYLEEEYYGKTADERAGIDPPYVDKTRIADLNARMISTFLQLYRLHGNDEYRITAEKSLDFMEEHLVDKRGVLHHYDDEKQEAFLTGQGLSNAWALLAFVEGYDTLGDSRYLETAEQIAEYSLGNLYDWRAGGIVERNSMDSQFYAPLERISLTKLYEENGVFTYAMLQLYLATGKLDYLESGMKTLGFLLPRTGAFDSMYYVIMAGRLVIDNDLLTVYGDSQEELGELIDQRLENFFIDDILEKVEKNIPFDDVPVLRDDFTDEAFYALALLAFLAGILSFISPCSLPVLSAYFAYTFKAKKGEITKNTLSFFFGLAFVFSLLGMGATLVGSIFRENRGPFTQVAGLVIIIFGILEILGKGFSGLHVKLKGHKKTPLGSFLFGAVFALGWSACIGPILASILLLSATVTTVVKGSALLFIYAVGLALPLVIISLYFDRIKNKRFWRILKGKMWSFSLFGRKVEVHSTSFISGIILIIIGILIFNDYLYSLNRLTLQTEFVQRVIVSGEEAIKNLLLRL